LGLAALLAGALALPAFAKPLEIRLPSLPYATLGAKALPAMPDPFRDIYVKKAQEHAPGMSDERAQELWYEGIGVQYAQVQELPIDEIRVLQENNIDPSYGKELLSIKNADCDSYFTYDAVVDASTAGITVDEARIIAGMMGGTGNDGLDIVRYWRRGLDWNRTAQLLTQYTRGKRIFSWEGALAYQRLEGEPAIAVQLAQQGLGETAIIKTYERHKELGWLDQIVQFDDTEKPNFLITYPTSDWNKAFSRKETVDYLKSLKEHHDVILRIVQTKQEAYAALDWFPDIQTWSPGGHGSKTRLSFSGDFADIMAGQSEDSVISTCDTELSYHMQNLAPDAVIFLDSCETGKGGAGADNLANHVRSQVGTRKVISSKVSFATKDMRVTSHHPFDVKIEVLRLRFEAPWFRKLFKTQEWAYKTVDTTYSPQAP
jgi:hypothetical protein